MIPMTVEELRAWLAELYEARDHASDEDEYTYLDCKIYKVEELLAEIVE